MKFLTLEKNGSTAIMSWDHNEQNQFTTPFIEEILSVYDEVKADDKLRALVVTSAREKYWSTGLHLQWMMTQGAQDPEVLIGFLHNIRSFLMATTSFPKPLIAAINGHAVGAAFIIAACMDYRLMIEDAGFIRLPEVQINIPFWPGMMGILKAVIPDNHLREFVYTGAKFTSVQGKEMGFIDALHPVESLQEKALELAEKLSMGHTDTYEKIKLELRREVLQLMDVEDMKVIEELAIQYRSAAG